MCWVGSGASQQQTFDIEVEGGFRLRRIQDLIDRLSPLDPPMNPEPTVQWELVHFFRERSGLLVSLIMSAKYISELRLVREVKVAEMSVGY